MSKIKIGNSILDLNLYSRIEISATEIYFCGDTTRTLYRKGVELSDANFTTLSAWLLNQANNPHTVVI